MARKSAGLLIYRRGPRGPEIFLVHPGGPFWAKKDLGSWSIPKGEPAHDGEDMLNVARREFAEETGQAIDGTFVRLPPCRLASGKIVVAWAVEGEIDESAIVSNTCVIEWPPHSGKSIEIPEVDCGRWFSLREGRRRINKKQVSLLDALARILGTRTKRRAP